MSRREGAVLIHCPMNEPSRREGVVLEIHVHSRTVDEVQVSKAQAFSASIFMTWEVLSIAIIAL